jgi:hypothetical protein
MGYHVGDVTGVVVKRKTGSEIIFYQQIGRSMSIASDERPLIIDFENADSELFDKAELSPSRAEAVDRIQDFVDGCDKSEDCNILTNIFACIEKNVTTNKISDDMLRFLYFDRHMPLYFIKGVAESIRCNETLESLAERIKKIQIKYNEEPLKLDRNIVNSSRLDSRLDDIIARSSDIIEEIESRGNKRGRKTE